MYLFVFLFILLTVLGVFTQVFAMQTARLFADQKAGAEVMLTWHKVAHRLARDNAALGFGVVPPDGCRIVRLGAPAWPNLPNACAMGGANRWSLRVPTHGSCAAAVNQPTCILPPGFTLNFESLVFQEPGGARALITFVRPPATLTDPTPPLGFTLDAIFQQLKRTDTNWMQLGTVVMTGAGPRVLPLMPPAGIPNYPVPLSGGVSVIPVNSVVIYTTY